jgi:dTMP kinase
MDRNPDVDNTRSRASRKMLIAIEGVDGAGTTTQTARLAARFGLHATREPSDGAIGKFLRQILRGEHGHVDETAVALLFAADRVAHVRDEIRALDRDVITDRYVLSSIVYQSLDVDPGFVRSINQYADPADLTLLIDVSAELAAERRAARGGPAERYDLDQTQRRLVDAYRREIVNIPNGILIDGSGTPDEVLARLVPHVESCLQRR